MDEFPTYAPDKTGVQNGEVLNYSLSRWNSPQLGDGVRFHIHNGSASHEEIWKLPRDTVEKLTNMMSSFLTGSPDNAEIIALYPAQ